MLWKNKLNVSLKYVNKPTFCNSFSISVALMSNGPLTAYSMTLRLVKTFSSVKTFVDMALLCPVLQLLLIKAEQEADEFFNNVELQLLVEMNFDVVFVVTLVARKFDKDDDNFILFTDVLLLLLTMGVLLIILLLERVTAAGQRRATSCAAERCDCDDIALIMDKR